MTEGETDWALKAAGAIIFLLGVVALATTIARNVRDLRARPASAPGTPQPLVIAMQEQFVERAMFDQVLLDLAEIKKAGEEREERIADKLDENWRALNKDRSVTAANLHSRVEAIHAAIRSETEAKFTEVRRELTDMPSRVVTLLRQTGAIGGHHHE